MAISIERQPLANGLSLGIYLTQMSKMLAPSESQVSFMANGKARFVELIEKALSHDYSCADIEPVYIRAHPTGDESGFWTAIETLKEEYKKRGYDWSYDLEEAFWKKVGQSYQDFGLLPKSQFVVLVNDDKDGRGLHFKGMTLDGLGRHTKNFFGRRPGVNFASPIASINSQIVLMSLGKEHITSRHRFPDFETKKKSNAKSQGRLLMFGE